MEASKGILAIALAASLSINGYLLWRNRPSPDRPVASAEMPVVIQIKGGRLEVSTVQAIEPFSASTDETILGLSVGKTVSRIRVPATYRYHVELDTDWKVLLKDKTFIVISPKVVPSLPVAIDTARLEAESSGRWSLFTGTTRLAELQRSITATLAVKAASPSYVLFQREAARQTLKEFVSKWLVTQTQWKHASAYPIRVFFADEPIQALSVVPQPFAGSL